MKIRSVEATYLYGFAVGILFNEQSQCTIMLGLIGIDIYWD